VKKGIVCVLAVTIWCNVAGMQEVEQGAMGMAEQGGVSFLARAWQMGTSACQAIAGIGQFLHVSTMLPSGCNLVGSALIILVVNRFINQCITGVERKYQQIRTFLGLSHTDQVSREEQQQQTLARIEASVQQVHGQVTSAITAVQEIQQRVQQLVHRHEQIENSQGRIEESAVVLDQQQRRLLCAQQVLYAAQVYTIGRIRALAACALPQQGEWQKRVYRWGNTEFSIMLRPELQV
jgi:hypothetical protein